MAGFQVSIYGRFWVSTEEIATASMADVTNARKKSITAHPNALPIFRCLPERVSGIPIALDNLPLAAERPLARLHDHENPNFLPIFLPSAFARRAALPRLRETVDRAGTDTG